MKTGPSKHYLKGRKLIDVVLTVLFLISLLCFFIYLKNSLAKKNYNFNQKIQGLVDDEFDSTLFRLNSMNKFISYCDSFYAANLPNRTYPGVVSQTMRKRFYHGYSYYTMDNNVIGVILEPIVKHGATAIVIPDDIVKYPNAACSQQSIVGMELFKRKGYPVRKVTMFDSVTKAGHFSFEVFYEKSWHFFDTDQEPDAHLLKEYNRPSVAFLAANPDIVVEAYRKKRDPQIFKRLVQNYKVGPVNKFPAPNAYLYQVVTKFFTYFGWLFFLVIIILKYLFKKNNPPLLFRKTVEKKKAVPDLY